MTLTIELAQKQALASALLEYFPGRPYEGYFDTASVGLVPAPVGAALQRCATLLGRGMVASESWGAVRRTLPDILASEFGCTPDELSFTASTGEALNNLARAIRWSRSDEVLVMTGDFPSVVLPWSQIPDGPQLISAEVRQDRDRTASLLGRINRRTRVVCVSHVDSFTGDTINLEALASACKDVGAFLIVDGAQSAGLHDGAVEWADAYVATGYKWLLSGFGHAVVALSSRLSAELKPQILGWANESDTRRLSPGNVNLFGLFAIQAATEVRASIGAVVVRSRTAEIVARVHSGLQGLGLVPAVPLDRSTNIVSLAGLDAEHVSALLRERGIRVAAREGWLRIAPYFYNDEADIDRLLSELQSLNMTQTAVQSGV